MDRKTNYPDSDETARNKHAEYSEDPMPDTPELPDLQTSNKSGKHSSVEKLSASRPEFSTGRGAVPVDGAFGKDDEERTDEKHVQIPGTS